MYYRYKADALYTAYCAAIAVLKKCNSGFTTEKLPASPLQSFPHMLHGRICHMMQLHTCRSAKSLRIMKAAAMAIQCCPGQ